VLTPPIHIALLSTSVLGTLIVGLACRRRHTWIAPLLWLVPLCGAVSLADGLLTLVGPLAPALALDGTRWDAGRMLLAFLVVLPPVELVTQWASARLAGGGIVRRPAR
jgi:hypothetical protein